MVNPRIQMDSEFWDLISSFQHRLSASRGNDPRQTTTELRHLAMFPIFIQRPECHLFEIAKTYMQLNVDSQKVKQLLDQCAEHATLSFSSLAVARHSRIQAAYAILCTLSIMLNSLLRIFDPCNASLMSEATFIRDEITNQAELASCYRPLGSAYVPLCLAVAWATSDNLAQLARIEAILAEYQTDFADIPWMTRAIWLASTLDSHRTRILSGKQSVQLGSNPVSVAASEVGFDTKTKRHSARAEACCIL